MAAMDDPRVRVKHWMDLIRGTTVAPPRAGKSRPRSAAVKRTHSRRRVMPCVFFGQTCSTLLLRAVS
jgi:hypothetical protein